MKPKKYVLVLCIAFAIFSVKSCNNESSLPDPLEAGWNGKKVCEVLEENENLRVLKCTFPPNVGHELHYHEPHFGYTLTGSKFRITDSTGTREVNVPSGYSFNKPEKTWHEALNIGDSTATFLIIEYK
ncbi:cupin domain-containing protein [Winogradskyella sp.]|uniref:cupin domain-containing protein n=1 Tax=Winogradskyella sp. TaxID=1883156 RepID=UPI0025CF79BA|nr:cupin domain-containing protein [Winogradskyella sp.]